jgi:hypothetical protein
MNCLKENQEFNINDILYLLENINFKSNFLDVIQNLLTINLIKKEISKKQFDTYISQIEKIKKLNSKNEKIETNLKIKFLNDRQGIDFLVEKLII